MKWNLFKYLFERDEDPVKKIKIKDLTITVEHLKGTKRCPEATKFLAADYGYVEGTKDPVEGDSVDVYVGSDLNSNKVFKLKQLNKNKSLDEYKYMLGFNSAQEASKAYLDSVDIGYFFYGGIEELPWEVFEDYLSKHKR